MTPPPDLAAQRRTLLLGAAALGLGGLLVWRGWRRDAQPLPPEPGALAATVVNDSVPVPAFHVASARGPITQPSLLGRWHIVFFGYTQCPDVCPSSLSLLTEALKPLPEAQRPEVLFISVDPGRDSVTLLSQYVPAFDPRYLGAVGTDESIAALVKHLGVHYERHAPGPGGHYTVDHTASLFLLDPQARLKAVFSPPHEAAAVSMALQRLIA